MFIEVNPGEPDLALRNRLNRVFAPAGGQAGVYCGNETLPFEAWSATGADPGSAHVEGVPPSAQIVAFFAAGLHSFISATGCAPLVIGA